MGSKSDWHSTAFLSDIPRPKEKRKANKKSIFLAGGVNLIMNSNNKMEDNFKEK